jgi:Zn-dependent peptidase ImmA (M78 family)
MKRRWASPEAAVLCKVMGEVNPIVAITKRAMALIDEAGFEGPPFPPQILASFRDVLNIRRTQMRGAARLVPEPGGLVIEVNQSHSPGKQNFSIDHEVVHTLMPTYIGQAVDDVETGAFADNQEEELLCDIGAATLLLDARWLRPLVSEVGLSINTLLDMAARFGASLQATARQIAALNLSPCAFIFWEMGYNKAERAIAKKSALPGMEELVMPQQKLRMQYPYRATSFDYFIPTNKSVEESSLVRACYQEEVPTAGIEWFDLDPSSARLYCENYYAPYWKGEELHGRVISLLLPASLSREQEMAIEAHEMERL